MLRYWVLCYHLFVHYFTVLVEGYARFTWRSLVQLSHNLGGWVGGGVLVSYLKMR